MTQPLAHDTAHVDPRDLARRLVAATTAITGIIGILNGRPLVAALMRAAAVGGIGILLVVAAEAIVRRVKRRVVR
jgi:hypothetical protein